MQVEKEYSYNRIVIIGNGYDKALGMPTSYKEFLLDYLKECFKSALNEPYSNDPLIKIEKINVNNTHEIVNDLITITDTNFLFNYFTGLTKIKKSPFLEILLDKIEANNWVDIESIYFNILVNRTEQLKKFNILYRDYTPILNLNKEFEALCLALDKYISKIDLEYKTNYDSPPISALNDEFIEKQNPKKAHIAHQISASKINNPENILFLNFNYTNSLSKIFNSTLNMTKYHILHIHGQINNQKNPLIFGYGDDNHHYYNNMELEDSLEPLMFIKSFHYPKTENYHTLLDFISNNKYEVFIVGHSCGLSDRTLLKTIFEDENCISIKIYHRGSEKDHFLKNIAISKHFSNKQSLRKKIMPYDEHAIIPQSK